MANRSVLSAEANGLLIKMLVSHAVREIHAAEYFESGAQFVPSRFRRYFQHVVDEEREHYAGCVDVARQLGLTDELLVGVRQRRNEPPPLIPACNSWLDLLLAHTFNDQAGYYVLQGLAGSVVEPYAELAKRIIHDEERHGSQGLAMLIAYATDDGFDQSGARRQVNDHLQAAIRCLGRPHSWNDSRAVELGLKTRSTTEVMKEFGPYADSILRRIGYADLCPCCPTP